MKKTQIKDIVRNIKANVVSWLAVVIVVTITCGVYCGVFFYADELEKSAGEFFEDTNFEDLTVTVAGGVTAEECRELTEVPGVQDIEGTYRLSGITLHMGGQSHGAEMLALTERISVPELVDGSLPSEDSECAMTADMMERFGVSLGDEVEVEMTGGISLTLKVTGVIRHPETYYQGESVYIFAPKSTFRQLFGDDIFPTVLIDASAEGTLLSDEYFADAASVQSAVMDKMEQISERSVVTARMDHESFMALRQIVDILRKLSTVFVVIFLVIGGIVVFSTITVIIDGQKQLIGFLKACGFRNSEIIRRYLIYGESAAVVGMLCTVGVAFVLQLVIKNVLHGMFCLEIGHFSFQMGSYAILFTLEIVLTGVISAAVTVANASKYSAMELMHWNAGAGRPRKSKKSGSAGKAKNGSAGKAKNGALYSRLIYRNMRTDWPRVGASVVIIAGCCFMIGIGFTLNSAFHSMTKNTHAEVAHYDFECTLTGPDAGGQNIDELEAAVLEGGADCVRVYKKQTVYRFGNAEEYITVVAAPGNIFQDYIHLIGQDGNELLVPDKGSVLIQNRISERLGINEGDGLTLFDGSLKAEPLRVSGTARNYIGRVMYLSEETFLSVFGDEAAPETLLVRLNGADRESFVEKLTGKFPELDISYTDSMPSLFSGLTDAFNALIFVLITLSVIMSVFVLLNLVNIFVSRRKNELIIMDINGFTYRERIGYLLRETIATTALGLLGGVLFGMAVTEPIVRIIESPDTMCVRAVNWKAWAVGVAAEAAFALLINLYAYRGVKHFDKGDLK